jgi:hypothetical protein
MSSWQTGPPPSGTLVEVELDGNIIKAKAVYGREGILPHWESEDGTCRPVEAFRKWRPLA